MMQRDEFILQFYPIFKIVNYSMEYTVGKVYEFTIDLKQLPSYQAMFDSSKTKMYGLLKSVKYFTNGTFEGGVDYTNQSLNEGFLQFKIQILKGNPTKFESFKFDNVLTNVYMLNSGPITSATFYADDGAAAIKKLQTLNPYVGSYSNVVGFSVTEGIVDRAKAAVDRAKAAATPPAAATRAARSSQLLDEFKKTASRTGLYVAPAVAPPAPLYDAFEGNVLTPTVAPAPPPAPVPVVAPPSAAAAPVVASGVAPPAAPDVPPPAYDTVASLDPIVQDQKLLGNFNSPKSSSTPVDLLSGGPNAIFGGRPRKSSRIRKSKHKRNKKNKSKKNIRV